MQYGERETCAGLAGKSWLAWLQQHDPQGFKWTERGELLINAQYMPTLSIDDSAQVYTLIQAVKGWVRKC